MAPPPHLNSVLRSGREAQTRRQCTTVAQDEIAPDEYPTFTRPISPELDESKRYTDDPPKRKRTNPWSFRRNSNSSESGDDCDQPLTRRLSRKASTVLSIFTPQRTRSFVSAVPVAQDVPEEPVPEPEPEPEELEEHAEPAATKRLVTTESRRSSLQKLKDFIKGRRKDSAVPAETLLPVPPLDEDDRAMGLLQRSSPKAAPSLQSEDPELFYMTGALPAPTPDENLLDQSGNSSLDPLLNPNLTESKRRKASTAVASLDSDSSAWIDAFTAATSTDADIPDGKGARYKLLPHLTGYSPPPTPKGKRARHYPYNAMPNFLKRRDSRKLVSASCSSKRVKITTALSTRYIAPWGPPFSITSSDTQPTCISTIGILPALSSEDLGSHITLPIFTLPTTTNSSTAALHTPSLPHTPASSPAVMSDCPASPNIDPTVLSDGRSGSTFALPSPYITPSGNGTPIAPEAHVPNPDFLDVPDVDTRPSTAADSTDEGEELRLRRSRSLRREAGALEGMEGMEGFEFVERVVGWRGGCGCGREGCGCDEWGMCGCSGRGRRRGRR